MSSSDLDQLDGEGLREALGAVEYGTVTRLRDICEDCAALARRAATESSAEYLEGRAQLADWFVAQIERLLSGGD